MANTASIKSQSIAHITVDGVYYGVFDVHDPIEVKAEIVRHRDGGSPSEGLIPVPSSTQPITVSRLYKAERDQALRALKAKVGPGVVSGGLQDLDQNMNAFGPIEPFTGLLSDYKGADGDSSSNDKRMISLTIEVSG